MDQSSERRHLCLKIRRGMLELDILFERFVAANYATLSPQDKESFEALLTEEDDQLFRWLLGSEALPAEKVEYARIIDMMKVG